MTTRIEIASISEPGSRSGNEDDLRMGQAACGWYAVLADGAGGHLNGAEAARRAVTCISAALKNPAAVFAQSTLTHAVLAAHDEVRGEAPAVATPQERMHCTVVALWLDAQAQWALWTHVGDSRLYRIRHGCTDSITVDDSVVQRLQQAGIIDADQARVHPKKNQLLAALGIEGAIEPHTLAQPVELCEGDVFLLCSDGWWDHFEPDALAASLGGAVTPQQWLADMQRHIVAQQRARQDNYSAIAVWVGDPAEVTQPLSRRPGRAPP